MEIASRLTDRDRDLLHLLRRHRVLTTHHIAEAFFGSSITARHRLTTLYELRLIDYFEIQAPAGSAPFHWVLDHAGWLVTSKDPDVKLRWSPTRAIRIQRSQRLQHMLGTNNFFCQLLGAQRRGDGQLIDSMSESQLKGECLGLVYPDGGGRWREANDQIEFFLEYDRGTETLKRLAAKLDDYERLAPHVDEPPWVLFCFQGPRRETNARRILGSAGLRVATATLEGHTSPHGAVWLPVGSEQARQRLAELTVA